MQINKYPDGTSYVTIPKEWKETTQELVFKIDSYQDLHYLCQLCEVLIWNRVKAHIIIPCLLDAQADKRFDEFHSSGLKTISMILNLFSNNRDISFGFFHPHNPEVVEALIDNIEIIDNTKFIREVVFDYHNGISGVNDWSYEDVQKNLILMSSDAGGFKPLMKLCDKINWKGDTFSASKGRDYKNGKTALTQTIGQVDFDGKDILIIDDISVYGGTFKGLAKLLKEANCGKLYLAVSHMTIQNLGEDPVTNYFDKVFTTNSKFDSYYFEKDLYLQSDNEGNEYMKKERVKPLNLEIISLF